MQDIWLIFNKEWFTFRKSDLGVFIIYLLMIIAWSFLFAYNIDVKQSEYGYLWLVFYSVIVCGNFSFSAFVSERMLGSLEILLTSGISRRAIIAGKVLFVATMSSSMGFMCYILSIIINALKFSTAPHLIPDIIAFGEELLLYTGACFMNTTTSAWLSLRISNPRLVPFVNLLVLGLVIVLFSFISEFIFLSIWTLTTTVIILGIGFYYLAAKDYQSERVIQPIVY